MLNEDESDDDEIDSESDHEESANQFAHVTVVPGTDVLGLDASDAVEDLNCSGHANHLALRLHFVGRTSGSC